MLYSKVQSVSATLHRDTNTLQYMHTLQLVITLNVQLIDMFGIGLLYHAIL